MFSPMVFSPSTFTKQKKKHAIFFPPFLEAPCDEIEATLLKGFRQFGSAIVIHRKCQGRDSVLRIDLDKCPTKHLDVCLFIQLLGKGSKTCFSQNGGFNGDISPICIICQVSGNQTYLKPTHGYSAQMAIFNS